jgi:hypothetical protein
VSRPFLHYLDELQRLNGEPRVTFPDSQEYPITERVYLLPIKSAIPAFGSAEPDATNYPNNKLVDISIYGHDRHEKKVYVRYERVPGYERIVWSIDGETNTPVSTKTQLIATPSLPITQVAGKYITFTPQNAYCGVLTTVELINFASITQTIKNPENFTFPRLVTAVTYYDLTALNGNVRIVLKWSERAEFTAMTDTELITTYYDPSSAPAEPTIEYAPQFNNLSYDGVFYNVGKSGVLNDNIIIPAFTTGTENPAWGYVVEDEVTFGQSIPSATQYMALTGLTRSVGRVREPWKYNLWRQTIKKVKLR